MGYVKDSVFLPPLPHDLLELWRRIIAAISDIERDMLQRVWAEMDYRREVCCVTKGGHIQHLRGTQKSIREFVSICRSPYATLSAIQVCRFYNLSQGIKNNTVYVCMCIYIYIYIYVCVCVCVCVCVSAGLWWYIHDVNVVRSYLSDISWKVPYSSLAYGD